MTEKFYITTAIDYVNARPHIGHAFEKVLADTIARWNKLQGKKVFFLTGTDENAQKNAQVAKEKGIDVKKFVDQNSDIFEELCKELNMDYNKFIRTTEKEHIKKSQEIFQKVYDKGEIYKGKYQGHYCIGCESFITEKELVNGKCPEHNKKPEWISEDAYFFKLSEYQKQLIKFVKEYIIPESKKNEILSRLENEELRDLCVSRTNLEWGIDSPIDKNFKIYVWFDALINYISGSEKNWPADLHVIGKGINWFHSVIWPAMLISAGYKLPKKLLVHGYLNIKGQKMSKSLGNVIDPLKLIEKYGADQVRYSLLKCNVFEDSDYSEEILIKRNNNELANKLGNLISRVSNLAEKNGLEKSQNNLIKKLNLKKIEKHFKEYELDKALNEIFAFIDTCNEYIQNKKPWETKDSKVLYELADSIKNITILLSSFIPETCNKIAKTFNFKINYENLNKPLKVSKIKKSEILFKKIEQNNAKNKGIKNQKNIEGIMSTINFKDFEKIDLRVGTIIKIEDIEGADKLYKLTIDLGSENRTICAGIKEHYKKTELKNKNIVVITNLASRKMRGIESQGMLLAAVSNDHKKVVLITPEKNISAGSKVS
jgi:methionyl-tRNA synthetase